MRGVRPEVVGEKKKKTDALVGLCVEPGPVQYL